MRVLFTVGLLMTLPVAAFAQEKKEAGPVKVIELKRPEPVVYEKDIEPIFYKRCVTCHSGSVKESNFDIGAYEGLIKGGKRGPKVLVPGKSADSLLYGVMSRNEKPRMPPKGEEPVTPEELALVKLWIDQGAKAPSGLRAKPKVIVSAPPANVNPVRALAVSPDKSTVAAGRGNQIHVYDAGSGTYIRSLVDPALKGLDGKDLKAAHLSIVESMAYSPDGKYLVSGGFQEVVLWDIQTGQLRQKLSGFAHAVVAVAFSLDSKLFAVAGGEPTVEGEIKVFEVGSWNKITDVKNGHSDTVYGICFSPDNKMIATASADKFIKVWEIPSGKFVKSFEGHTHHVLDVGWTSDGKLLASAGGDNTVKVWDFEKGEQARTINAHGKQVTRLSFIGKKAEFVTCGGDGQVKFFNAQNGGNIRNFSGGADFVYAIGVSPDGTVVASGGQDGVVRVFNGATGALTRELLPPGVAPPAKK
ncbi:MAG: NB-ARC domain protein [Planctomycetes bacterium]|nr:NB-ARC domain protein [Planctomycetota bacterium]